MKTTPMKEGQKYKIELAARLSDKTDELGAKLIQINQLLTEAQDLTSDMFALVLYKGKE